ncbi:MAG: gamma carbonic anhydrase family protein [Atopobiaceae bacterium]|nr:gamma carbonic anhydrase family protein [Atopobiaceae bacterium]MBR1829995.1 gamma carbonic anhydrase family protein [Atopobiaceae bacterium]
MPNLHPTVRVAPGAHVIGDATLGEHCTVWYNAVIRADEAPVTIGAKTNVQDCAVVHVSTGHPVSIGDGVTIGHGAIVHGCTMGSNSLIGMGAIVLDGAEIGGNCIIGAGALVTQGTRIPDGHMAFGSPARVIRPLTEEEIRKNRENAQEYVRLAETLAP